MIVEEHVKKSKNQMSPMAIGKTMELASTTVHLSIYFVVLLYYIT